MKCLFNILILLSVCSYAKAANPKPITGCIKDMSVVNKNELLVTDTSIRRIYTLCANTVFTPGVATPAGEIIGGQEPLVCRSNCLIKCGETGKSSNNCVIDGTGNFGIFQVPYNLYADRPRGSTNVVYQGITIDFFVQAGQISTLAAAFFGDVTFLDCIWSNNSGDPIFVLSELALGGGITSRSSVLDSTPSSKPPGFVWNMTEPHRQLSKQEISEYVDADTNIAEIKASDGNNKRRLRASDIAPTEGSEISTEGDRILQTTGGFRVIFQDCLFDFNDPVRNAKTQGGLSLLRLTGTDVTKDSNQPERLGTGSCTFLRCEFKDNVYNFNNDVAAYRSLIDFFSRGTLTLRQNCFFNSPTKNYGIITVQKVNAKVVNEGNFIKTRQAGLKCPFISILDPNYNILGCGTDALGKTCTANTATKPPAGGGGGICFPGDAIVELKDKRSVKIGDLKLGDKVLVQGGKYETVYSFGHRAPSVAATYVRLLTINRFLEVSMDHMVYLEDGRTLPASNVKVGDKLKSASGNSEIVRSISFTSKSGAYAPFTPSGSVVVNGFVVSCFVAFQNSPNLKIAGFDTQVSYQWLAHSFELPHRMWCKYVSDCRKEMYTGEGISVWVAAPLKFTEWFVSQDASKMTFIAAPLLMILGFMAYPITFIVLVLVSINVCRVSFYRSKA